MVIVSNVGKAMPQTTHDWYWFIAPIKMVMTWGWLMALFYQHYSIHGVLLTNFMRFC